jgi:hypothetical protein
MVFSYTRLNQPIDFLTKRRKTRKRGFQGKDEEEEEERKEKVRGREEGQGGDYGEEQQCANRERLCVYERERSSWSRYFGADSLKLRSFRKRAHCPEENQKH